MRTLPMRWGAWCAGWGALLLLVGAVVGTGCEVDKVKFNRLVEGQRFLNANDPFQAAVYFEESLSREPETREKALAWLVVALDRSLQKVANIPEKRQEYESQLNRWLEEVRANPKAMAFLVDILDEHSVNSQSAARLLARLGPDASKALLNAYRTKPEEQAVILDIFRQIGPSILPALQEAVRSNDDLTNREKMLLVRLIGEVGGESAVAFLREIRNNPAIAEGVRLEAAAQLYRLGDKSQRDALIAGLDSERPLVREAASSAMSYLNESPRADLLLRHLNDSNPRVRENLVRALGRHRSNPEAAIPKLIEVIRTDSNLSVTTAAQKALGEYGPAVIEPVMEALRTERDWTRRQQLVQVLNHERVRPGFTQDQEYRLYEYYEKGEQNELVRNDIGRVLTQLEQDRQQASGSN